MKKVFKLENLDCANCAAKIETAINKIEGVKANVNFMSQRLTIEAEDSLFDAAVEAAESCIRKVEPDCVIVKSH